VAAWWRGVRCCGIVAAWRERTRARRLGLACTMIINIYHAAAPDLNILLLFLFNPCHYKYALHLITTKGKRQHGNKFIL
jgi:hypothetical protein